MYIPAINRMTDRSKVISFMQQFSFGTLVTVKEGVPVATHLPFVVSEQDDQVIISSHLARANDQWKTMETGKAMVIFSEPHAYISPSHYDKEQNVPTWNYLAVHAYGTVEIISDEAAVIHLLEITIHTYEESYKQQWERLSDDYKYKMAKGIVAFRIKVTDLQAKEKLSQNKTAVEQQSIIESLGQSNDTNEQLIAAYMRNNLLQGNTRNKTSDKK